MEHLLPTLIFLLALLLLLGTGVWVGLSLLGVALIGIELFTPRPAGDSMITTIWTTASSWSLTALPLFIWMGEILYRTRLSQDMFRGLSPWMTRIPGRLLHTNILGCTIFAAVSGSSAATLTTVGKMSIPELRKRRYPEHMLIGTLTGAATLGLMIPPSLTLIVYGVAINQSISQLFLAGVLPGLVLAALFMLYVILYALLAPKSIPAPTLRERTQTLRQKLKQSRFLIPIIGLILGVIGSIYLGIATATEAAAFGVLGALILAALQRSLTRATFTAALIGAVRTSAMIALILMGAAFLSLSMGFTGLPRAVAEWIATLGLSKLSLLLALMLFYIVIGCFLDGISAVVLTIAVVEPLIRQAGIDLIWFGIFIVVVVEMAQITPPIGFNLFVMQGIAQKPIGYIARTALPMFLLLILMVLILITFPQLATYLPTTARAAPL